MKLKTIIYFLLFYFIASNSFANTPKSSGKYKNWESFTMMTDKGKVCFSQTKPVKRAPAAIKRKDSRIFVTFRPNENIKDEISITSGHTYKNSTVSAKSGKKSYDLFSKGKFAWVVDNKDESKLIITMKKASRLMIIGNTDKGDQTTHHYSMMGFTKAYNAAKKSCS